MSDPVTDALTLRKDRWWLGPLLMFLGILAFVIYATWAGMAGRHFEIRENGSEFAGRAVAPYLSPFYHPLIFDATSGHAWIKKPRPDWWPLLFPFSSAIFVVWAPAIFRLTCYYFRKAYYRAIWADPPACAVGEPRKTYWGENRFPLILQNLHRYALYLALLMLATIWVDAVRAFWWPTDRGGLHLPAGTRQFGIGVGSLVLLADAACLTCYVLGCHCLRHLVGGRKDRFSCATPAGGELPTGFSHRFWRFATRFNEQHALWAWVSLVTVGATDVYIRLCSMGVISDIRIL
ncbi:MAG: succinate dehydrogenase [Planctomycetota bacterium]